jgi:hypothetical protein
MGVFFASMGQLDTMYRDSLGEAIALGMGGRSFSELLASTFNAGERLLQHYSNAPCDLTVHLSIKPPEKGVQVIWLGNGPRCRHIASGAWFLVV